MVANARSISRVRFTVESIWKTTIEKHKPFKSILETMARNYTMLDLLRFRKYAQENPDLKPMELISGYNSNYPEKTYEEKVKNLLRALEIDFPQPPEPN